MRPIVKVKATTMGRTFLYKNAPMSIMPRELVGNLVLKGAQW